MNTVLQVATEEPVPPSRLQSKVPIDLETICLKCLEKKSAQRYASALELAEELTRFLNGEPILARPISTGRRALKWAKRRPAAAALVFVSITAGVLLFFYSGALAVQRNAAVQAEEQARQDRDRAQVALLKAEQAGYVNRITLSHRELQENNVGRALDLLEGSLPSMRHWEYNYLHSLCETRLRIVRAHDKAVRGVAFSPDGSRLASGGDDKMVRLWDPKTGKSVQNFSGHGGPVLGVAFSPDGQQLASASGDKTVKVRAVGDGREICVFRGHAQAARCVSFSVNGRLAASGDDQGVVKIWDAASGREQTTCRGHTASVTSVSFSRDGQRLASVSDDHTLRLWDVTTGRPLLPKPWSDNGGAKIKSVLYSPDGQFLIAGGEDQLVRFWRADTGGPVGNFPVSGDVVGLCFNTNGQRLAISTFTGTVHVHDVTAVDADHPVGKNLQTLSGPDAELTGVAYTPDGHFLATAGADGGVAIWNLEGGESGINVRGVGGRVAFSPDGRTIATEDVSTAKSGRIALLDAATGQTKRTLSGGPEVRAFGLDFSPDGQRLVSGGPDKNVILWDVAAGRAVHTLSGHTNVVEGVAFSPDGKLIASASGETKIWDAATRQERHNFPVATFRVAFSPDSRRLAGAGQDGKIRIWDVSSGKELLSFGNHVLGNVPGASAVAFSPDGQRLATAGIDRVIKLWDAATGRELLHVRGHGGLVEQVAFSPDGRRLVSGGSDQTMRLWDTATGQELLTFRGHSNTVSGVAFSKDGRRMASAGSELKIFDAPSMSLASASPTTTPDAAGTGGWGWLLVGGMLLVGLLAAGVGGFVLLRKRKPARPRVRARP
jgi:WD40 repeat protein